MLQPSCLHAQERTVGRFPQTHIVTNPHMSALMHHCVILSRIGRLLRASILHLSPDRQTPSIFCKRCYLIKSKLLPLSRPTQVCPLCIVITDRANVTRSAHQLPWHCVITAFALPQLASTVLHCCVYALHELWQVEPAGDQISDGQLHTSPFHAM